MMEREAGILGTFANHHKEWCTGRVAHFEFVGGGDKLATVPKACAGLGGEDIDHGRDGKCEPSE